METNFENRLFRIEIRSDKLIVWLTESRLSYGIDAEILKVRLLQVVDERSPNLVVVDFSAVRYFSSAFISSLLLVRKRVVQYGGRLAVSGMTVPLNEVFSVLRLDQLIESYKAVDLVATSKE